MDRTAAEYPSIGAIYPRLADLAANIYYHEVGRDENGAPMAWTLTTPPLTMGKKTTELTSIVPDSHQTGDVSLRIREKLWPRSVNYTYNKTFNISQTEERLQLKLSGRFWDYTLSGNQLNQDFRMGVWQEEMQEMSDR